MPKQKDIRKIVVLGSGPSTIGRNGETDEAGTQACRALRSLGYEVVAVDSNPANRFTDKDVADVTYIEPLNVKTLAEVIDRERPDALLATTGGQVAQSLARDLSRKGILASGNIRMMGAGIETIDRCESGLRLRPMLRELGLKTPAGQKVASLDQAVSAAESLGYPVVVRPSYASAGLGTGPAYNKEELLSILDTGLAREPTAEILLEASVDGLNQFEIQLLRDRRNRFCTVGVIEYIDPVGVHSGDAIAVFPAVALEADIRKKMETASRQIAQALEIEGSLQVKMALDRRSNRFLVMEVNPRLTRSTAFVSKATGLPLSYLSTLIAAGMEISEIEDEHLGPLDDYSPPGDLVAVRHPRWAFETYPDVQDRLDSQMRSVGSAIGIGRTFNEALLKSVRALDIGKPGFMGAAGIGRRLSLKSLLDRLHQPTSKRLSYMVEALDKGAGTGELGRLTGISSCFIEQLKDIKNLEQKIRACSGQALPRSLLAEAKKTGLADDHLAALLGEPASEIRHRRLELGITPKTGSIPVFAHGSAVYHYATYHGEDASVDAGGRKIVVLGCGPNQIGLGGGLDSCCVNAAMSLKHAGCYPVIVNPNPESVACDVDGAAAVYLDPLSLENVLDICAAEQPQGVVVQFGGQNALRMAGSLTSAGISVLGTPPSSLEDANDRSLIRSRIRKLSIPQPMGKLAATAEQALRAAGEIGYPVMVRPALKSETGGKAVLHDTTMMANYLDQQTALFAESPLWIDKFLDNALEAEIEALVDGAEIFFPAVMEQIELAGIHTGDSACVIPSVGIPPKHVDTITEYVRLVAADTEACGLMNIQFAFYRNTVYLLDVHHGACRTVPLVSKVCGFELARMSTQLQLGRKLSELGIQNLSMPHYGVREAVFPFAMFPEADPALGPNMQSTGEVLGLAPSFGLAFCKAQEATRTPLPDRGTVLFTIADEDKPASLEPARLFRQLGFDIAATPGTHEFLSGNGIQSRPVKKLGYGRPDILDAVKTGEIQLMVNTPLDRRSTQDNAEIRRSAVKYNVLSITTTAAAMAAARGIAARRKGSAGVTPARQAPQTKRL